MIVFPLKWLPWIMAIGGAIVTFSDEGNLWTLIVTIVGIIWIVASLSDKSNTRSTPSSPPSPPPQPQIPQSTVNPQPNQGSRFCTKCGTKVEGSMLFCSNCGARLQ